MDVLRDRVDEYSYTELTPVANHTQDNINIFRATSIERNGQKVFLKLANPLDSMAMLQLKHEWNVLVDMLNAGVPGLPQPLSWEVLPFGSGIVSLDEDGAVYNWRETYLASTTRIDLSIFLKQLRSLCTTLKAAHDFGVRHGNIRPDIITNQVNSTVTTLRGWTYSSRLDFEPPNSDASVIGCSLHYIAPEVTGRIHRKTDSRADLYSLGITLYEVLTGRLPFTGDSPLEIMHQHISKTPIAPSEIVNSIPAIVDELVLKLLKKSPDDRYQSADGLLADVSQIAEALEQRTPLTRIEIGKCDQVSRFTVAQSFVGRSSELQTLIELYRDLEKNAKTQVAVISGLSGVGKSRLVKEMMQTVAEFDIYYSESKFDQSHDHAPLATLTKIVSDLLSQIFVQPQSVVALWRSKIANALGEEANVLVNMCPHLATLLTSKYLQTLSDPTGNKVDASEKILKRSILALIRMFATDTKKLIIFLDDIQWAMPDYAQILVDISALPYVYILLAYRGNEVGAAHHIQTNVLEKIRIDARIDLGPLSQESVTHLVDATLQRRSPGPGPRVGQDTKELCRAIFLKTQGNAFYVTQLLQNLYAEKLLTFDVSKSIWSWDIESIRAIGVMDDVVDLLLQQLVKLSAGCQGILKLASCLGNTGFDLVSLSLVSGQSPVVIANYLWEVLRTGLVIPTSNLYRTSLLMREEFADYGEYYSDKREGFTDVGSVSDRSNTTAAMLTGKFNARYRFLHDRVQQVCYSLIPGGELNEYHLNIGKRLVESSGPASLDSMIFDICYHMNHGIDFLDIEAKAALGKMNLLAGKKSLLNGAFSAALQYTNRAGSLLSSDLWTENAFLAEDYYTLVEEVNFCNSDFEGALAAAQQVSANTNSVLVKLRMCGKQMTSLMLLGKVVESIDLCFSNTLCAGTDMSTYLRADKQEVAEQLEGVRSRMLTDPREIRKIADLPVMTDEIHLATQQILADSLPAVPFCIATKCADISRCT